jgi:hypothetical protein
VGLGARCVTCPEKRRRVLKAVELFGAWQPMCFNCSGQLLHLDPMPDTIAKLRELVSRERRREVGGSPAGSAGRGGEAPGFDRRLGKKPDTRVFQYERRVGERRASRSEYPQIDDDMIIEVIIEPLDNERELEIDFEELTQIRELVHDLRPAELAG